MRLNYCVQCTTLDEKSRDDLAHFEHVHFDYILAADIVAAPYRRSFKELLQTLNVLCGERSTILLAYKPRCASEFEFFRKASQYFCIERTSVATFDDVSLLTLRRKRSGTKSQAPGFPGTGSLLGDF